MNDKAHIFSNVNKSKLTGSFIINENIDIINVQFAI